MSVKGKPAPLTTEETSVETVLARAMVAASKIVTADRDPTAEEAALISDAQVRAEAAGVEVGAAFVGYQRHVEHRAQLAAEAARREEERQQKEERRRDWLDRPARFRRLPDQVQLLHVMGQFLLPDEPLRGRDVLAALDGARKELLLPVRERAIPYTFEPGIVAAAKRDGFTRDGVQHVGDGE